MGRQDSHWTGAEEMGGSGQVRQFGSGQAVQVVGEKIVWGGSRRKPSLHFSHIVPLLQRKQSFWQCLQ